jgi:protein RecA
MATKEESNSILDALNKAKVGGEDGAGNSGYGTDLTLASHVKFGIPSRIPQLDLSMGRPGYPAGRVIELFGLPASGKTTAAYHALAQCQKMGGLAVLIDTEATFDPARAAQCGIEPSRLMVTEANDIEEIFEKIEVMLEAYGKDETLMANPIAICVDSVTAVETRYNAARGMELEVRVGEDARAIRRGLRKVNKKIANLNACLFFINHSTALIGKSFGKQSDSAGGNAIKFFASVRVEFAYVGNITEGKTPDEKIRRGQVVNLTLIKNKVEKTHAPTAKVELTENGFDIYEGLFEAFQTIGALERVNNTNWHFLPTKTTLAKKEWRALLDGYTNKEGVVLGLDGFYKYFLRLASNDKFITAYGASLDS